jgi:hypothetical protein
MATIFNGDLPEAVCKPIRLASLVKLEGADHSFRAGKKDTMPWLVDATKEWMEKIITRRQIAEQLFK